MGRAGNVAVEEVVSAANLHPADPGTAPGPRRARLERTGILHVLLLHVLQSPAWAEKETPVLECEREPMQLVSCSIVSCSIPSESLPPARPTASLIHAVSQPVFPGAGTSFLVPADGIILEVGREKRIGGIVLHIRPRLTEVSRQYSDTRLRTLVPYRYVSTLFRHQILGGSS